MLNQIPISSNGDYTYLLTWYLLLVLIVLIIFSTLLSATRRRVLVTLRGMRTITVLQCEKCDYKEEREFQVGDYVLKRVGECAKCKGPLYISMIYGVPEKGPPRPYGY
jgi:hypothetical protein